MSSEGPPLFSEAQLSQIATMMPALAEKSKLQSGNIIPLPKSIQKDGTPQIAGADLGATNEETKKGISRLSDFLHQKKKKEPTPPLKTMVKTELKELVPLDFVLVPSPQELKCAGLKTYAWVENAYLKTNLRGTHFNRFF